MRDPRYGFWPFVPLKFATVVSVWADEATAVATQNRVKVQTKFPNLELVMVSPAQLRSAGRFRNWEGASPPRFCLRQYLERHIAVERSGWCCDLDRACGRSCWHLRDELGVGDHAEGCRGAVERHARGAGQIVSEERHAVS